MKKSIYLILSLVLVVFLFTGCGGNNSSVSTEANNEKIVMKLATQHPTDHMAYASALRIKEKVETETNGHIEIQIYPANQLGDYVQVYEEVIRGTIEMAHIGIPDQFDSRLSAGFMPYLAKNYDEVNKVFGPGSYLSEEMAKFHKDLGVKFLGYYCEGMMGIGTIKTPDDPADFTVDKNVLLRVAPMDSFKFGPEALGYRTTTIPYSDTFAALQTGVADGWSGGAPNINYLSFRDVIKNYYQYNLHQESTQYVMNLELFNSLTPEEQKIIVDAFGEESANSAKEAEKEDKIYKEKLKEAGVNVVEFSPEELEAMAEHVRTTVWPKLYEGLTKELVMGILDSLK